MAQALAQPFIKCSKLQLQMNVDWDYDCVYVAGFQKMCFSYVITSSEITALIHRELVLILVLYD